MNFQDYEDSNGLRMSFQTFPTTKRDQDLCALPFGFLYTPLRQISNQTPLTYQPVFCQNCHSALNPYCTIDYQSHYWTCPICHQVNRLPDSYNQMTSTNLCAELMPQYCTIEYSLQSQPSMPIFLFIVDTCTSSDKEFDYLKTVLLQTFASLPRNSTIGFITYGTEIYIHEVRFSECPRSYVFSGTKTYTTQQLQDLLSISPSQSETNPFLVSYEDSEATLSSLVDGQEKDPFPVSKGHRALRCTGAALHLGLTLLECLFPTRPASIMILSSGPITKGPGAMASDVTSTFVRQHSDLNSSTLSQSSLKFFTELGNDAASHSISINYLSACFEETGMYEVEPAISATGGFFVNCESWSDANLTQTLVKYFDGGVFSSSASEATLKIITPSPLHVSQCIAPCTEVSGQIIEGHPTAWHFSSLLPSTTAAIYLDLNNNTPIQQGSTAAVQFQTRYRSSITGEVRLRVTTTQISFSDLTNSKMNFIAGLDQQAAAVLIARKAMSMLRVTTSTDSKGVLTLKPGNSNVEVVRYIDRTLAKACRTFGQYQKGNAQSLTLPPQIANLPEFMFHLRRGQFLSTFNSTPDLTASLRQTLMWEDTSASMFMIQPMLKRFSLESEPMIVPLDMQEVKRNSILLLDTYYRVLVWTGVDVVMWKRNGLQNDEQYKNIKDLIEFPQIQAKEIVEQRFPTPMLVNADEGTSQARYLLARVSTASMEFSDFGKDGADAEDTSLTGFIKKLTTTVVSQ